MRVAGVIGSLLLLGVLSTFDAAVVAAPPPLGNAGLRIEMLSMGQADAMLILGSEKSVLVDCGAPVDGADDGYKRVASEIRRLTGGSHVDYLIVTHFHSDHTGEPPDRRGQTGSGLWGLFDDAGITAGAVLDHGDDYPWYGEANWIAKKLKYSFRDWQRAGRIAERRIPQVDDRIDLGGGAALTFVAVNGNGALLEAARRRRFSNGEPSENDYSVGFVVTLGAFEMFCGGDMSGEDSPPRASRRSVYTDIERTVARRVGNVEVLRANHHGSSHSTSARFVDALRPEVSLVSAGRNNPFGHPTRSVLDRLRPLGPIYVTANTGDVEVVVSLDGARYEVGGAAGGLRAQKRSYTDDEEARGYDHAGPGATP